MSWAALKHDPLMHERHGHGGVIVYQLSSALPGHMDSESDRQWGHSLPAMETHEERCGLIGYPYPSMGP